MREEYQRWAKPRNASNSAIPATSPATAATTVVSCFRIPSSMSTRSSSG